MKVRISPTGNLEIFRKYEYKVQTCCYHQFKYCGDHCPMFQEPRLCGQDRMDSLRWIEIVLCQNRKLAPDFEDFEDLRAKQKTEYDYTFKSLNDGGDDV